MQMAKLVAKDIHYANVPGKLFMLGRKIPSVASKIKPVLEVLKTQDIISRVEGLLKNMGVKMGIRSIVRRCHQIIGGTLVSVVLSGIPIAFAVLQDGGIGKDAMIEIGELVGGLIGDAIGGLVAGALSGIVVPLVVEVGEMIGFGITEIAACTIVGTAFCGVGAIIGTCVGGLIAVGVHLLVPYVKRVLQAPPGFRDKALCGATPQEGPGARAPKATISPP